MLKYWRIWLLVLLVLFSVFAIGMKTYPYGRSGVVVAYVAEDSPAKGIILTGDQITKINEFDIKNTEDWEETQDLFGQTTFVVNGEERVVQANGTLEINVVSLDRLNLDLGLDLKGGTRILLKPTGDVESKELIDQTIETLRTRSNLFGLAEIKIKQLSGQENLIQIEASGIGSNVINDFLTKTGEFEAKVSKPVAIQNSTGLIDLGENKYPFIKTNDSIIIDSKPVTINETFVLEEIVFELAYLDDTSAVLLGTTYKGEDIELIYNDPQRTGIQPEQGGYSFFFTVLVSKSGAEKFAKVTSGIPSYFSTSGQQYLQDSEIFLYLDGELKNNLQIASSLGGVPYTTPQITGFSETRDEARAESFEFQTILRSGALPLKMETVSTDIISPTLGANFLPSAGMIGGIAALVVFLMIFVRYKRIKIALPMVLVALSEVILLLGIAAINDASLWVLALFINMFILGLSWSKKHEVDMFAWVGALSIPILGATMSWTIDLPAIAGIIAFIGTGIDHQIIIADETLRGTREKIKTLKEKLRSAFFIIFGAASTTIFTMLPLIFLVAEFVRGFALTTIIGVWIGITITRPAYARVIEVLLGKEQSVQDNL